MPTTIVLVRHGETDWNRENRFQGHADEPLNDAGRGQARQIAETLRSEPIAAVYTSPLRRARETAAIVARRLGLEAHELEALREIDVGDWQGLTIDEVKARFPEFADVNWRSGWSGGESHDELAARVVAALLDLGRRHPDASVVGITHAGPIRATLMAATALSLEELRKQVGPLPNCAAFRFSVRDGRLELDDVTED
jgi:broad specificity phosphatase PhoE